MHLIVVAVLASAAAELLVPPAIADLVPAFQAERTARGSVTMVHGPFTVLRSKYADENVETYVELEFLCKEKLYKVRRNPQYTRQKARGEGTTEQVARAELHFPDGKIIDKSKREVTNAITEIIGIDRDQFLQIAMILSMLVAWPNKWVTRIAFVFLVILHSICDQSIL